MNNPNQVHVRFFAIFREFIGVKDEWTEIEPGTTVEQLWLRYAEHARNPRVVNIRAAYSVNQRLAKGDTVLQGGEEVGFLPPVSGGAGAPNGRRQRTGETRRAKSKPRAGKAAGRRARPASATGSPDFFVTSKKLDLGALIRKVEHPGAGAIVTFTGVVRDHAHERPVKYLEYEAYAGMAAHVLKEIGAEACARWPGVRMAMGHRTGRLGIGGASVVIAVSSPHRAEAFAACRYAIERIKAVLPIWKKEFASDGEYWVEGPVAGDVLPEQAEAIARTQSD